MTSDSIPRAALPKKEIACAESHPTAAPPAEAICVPSSMLPMRSAAKRPSTAFSCSARSVDGASATMMPPITPSGTSTPVSASVSTTSAASRSGMRRASRRCRGAQITYRTPIPSSPEAKGRSASEMAMPRAATRAAARARWVWSRVMGGCRGFGAG